jgi:hypothetical protein
LLDVTQNSECLFQFFRDRIHDFARHAFEFEPAIPIKDADPWLLASLLQKAIRRGDVAMARRAAHHLLNVDPQRLWRRLMTVALEDIGIGDSEISAELTAIATLPLARRLVGDNGRAVDVAVKRACAATKDRAGDHFGSLEHQLSIRDGLEAASMDARLAVLGSSTFAWQRRLHAAVLLSGETQEKAHQRVQTFRLAANVFEQLGVPVHLIAACETYAARARDRLPIFVLLAWCLWHANGASRAIVTHVVSEPEWLDQLPGYAFDPIRTRLGRRAVDLWLRSYFQKPPFDARQVAIALWNMESAACARTLSWPLGQVIEQQARSADLLARGLPAERHEEIAAWIVKEHAALGCARRAVWESVRRNM